MVTDTLRPYIKSATLTFDKCGDRVFKTELAKYLKGRTNEENEEVIRKIKFEESHTNQLLQLADMICGAVARSRKTEKDNPDRFRNIVKQREWILRVWP
jgi:hypothetical protein